MKLIYDELCCWVALVFVVVWGAILPSVGLLYLAGVLP